MSWWNPFAWTPGGSAGAEGRDEREEAGIWGGLGAPGGLHAGMVLGEGSVITSVNESPKPLEALVPSEVATGYGTVGAMRGAGAELGELGETAWRALAATPVAAGEPGASDVGTELADSPGIWERDVAGDPVTR